MYEQVEKPKENKSRASANSVAQKKNSAKQNFGFVDNRPESVVQRKLQEIADDHLLLRNPIQKKTTMSAEVLQRGGQLGKTYRTTKESLNPPKPVSTGGMWLVETEAANGFHQQVRIGSSYQLAFPVSFGYAGNGNPASGGGSSHDHATEGGSGDGEVYVDQSKPTKQIQHCPMTKEQVDAAMVILRAQVGQTGEYDVMTKNCVHWSMRTFDHIKSEVKK